ncbi:MAG: DUF5916 domain-containing protein [Cyclobacteriaceae bacterium]
MENRPCLKISETSEAIRLDGIMDEEIWQKADVAQNFWQNFPMDTSLAVARSEIRMAYDDQFIYIFAKCYSTSQDGDIYYVTPSLRRDFRGAGNDMITFIFDTFQDQTNAVVFGINPYGVQREGLVANGGFTSEDYDLSWDNKWYSAAKIYPGYWTAEAAIPFKSIRYKEESDQWRLQFYRLDSHSNERSTWSRVPRNFRLYSLAYTGKLMWDKPLKKAGPNISLIPYVAGGGSRDFIEGKPANRNFSAGGDAKVAVTSSLNLDLTVNPDFSQVEVDQQVTNLDRFEIFFPERRQFFLENADLFANFGLENARPFFSRRIGVAIDSTTGQNVQNPIRFGARLSGSINRNWRVGLLNMQTGEDESINLPSLNYTVGAVQRRMFERSNISAIFINKQSLTDTLNDDFTLRSGNYNRLIGLDYNLASADNTWTGKFYYHRTIDPEQLDNTYSHGAVLNFSTLRLDIGWQHQMVGENFNAEVGFVPRTDFNRINPSVAYRFFPKSEKIVSHGPGVIQQLWWNEDLGITDANFALFYEFTFTNTSSFTASFLNDYVYLFAPFTPSREGLAFEAGEDFQMNSLSIEYRSDRRKAFFYDLNTIQGQYYDGSLNFFNGTLSYRAQPYGLFSLDMTYSRIKLDEPYTSADIFLIGPRMDLTFSKSVFFTTFVQYNSQFENINVNSRFQWRFQPVSDLFIVYTDNYIYDFFDRTNNFAVKNRALVVKLTYWLNV